MKRGYLTLLVVVLVAFVPFCQIGPDLEVQNRSEDTGPSAVPAEVEVPEDVSSLFSNLGGAFVENRGQLDRDDVAFYAVGQPLSVAFGQGWVDYCLRRADGDDVTVLQFRVTFEGASSVGPVGGDTLDHPTNFIRGSARGDWVSGVRSFSEVLYQDLWDGVDLRFHMADGKLKYDLVVSPDGDVADIAFSYEGVDGLSLDTSTQDLLVHTSLGVVREDAPRSYHLGPSGTSEVASAFSISGGDTLAFCVPDRDPRATLVIDPGLEFSTLFGASGDERIEGSHLVEVGPGNTIYIAGTTTGDDLPITPGAFCDTFRGGQMMMYDAFVAKFSSDGSTIIYCTYLGGTGTDTAYALDVDAIGRAAVVGYTFSDDFPVSPSAHQGARAGASDGYFAMLDAAGSSLVHGTYLGGSAVEAMWGVRLDGSGNAYILGDSSSSDYPTTTGAFSEAYTSDDIVVTKLSVNTGSLVYSTYVASAKAQDLVVDGAGRAVVVGSSGSNAFPTTTGALQTSRRGADDGVVFMLEADGSGLVFATFFGGNRDDHISGVALNSTGGVWVCGQTYSSNLLVTPDAFQTTFAGPATSGDGFFARLSSDGTSREYVTYYGVSGTDRLWDIELMADGEPVVVGMTRASGFLMPTRSYDSQYRGSASTGVLAWFDTEEGRLLNATYLGDVSEDLAGGGTLDIGGNGLIAVTGSTWSLYFPTTPNANDTTYDWQDIFVLGMRFDKVPWEPPTVPLNIATSGGDEFVDITWDRPSSNGGWPILGYRVYREDSPGCATFLGEALQDRTFSDAFLNNGWVYNFSVSAFNGVGEGVVTELVSGVPFTLPWEPKNFTVRGGRDVINLSWEPPLDSGGPPISGYGVYRGLDVGTQTFLIDVLDDTTFTDTDVVSGTRYYYKVQAFHEFARGAFTTAKSAKSVGIPTAPLDMAAEGGDRIVTLTWTTPLSDGGGTITEYFVYRGTEADALARVKSIDPGISHTDTGLFNGMTYYYAMTAVNEAGEGPRSKVAQATPVGTPDAPRELVVEEGDGSVTLTWQVPDNTGGSDITEYQVFRGAYDDALSFLATSGMNVTYTDENVVNGQTYYYHVRAANDAGVGSPSETLTAVPMGPPSPPDRFTVEVGECLVKLAWLSPADNGGSAITVYRVYRGETPDAMAVIEELDASSMSLTDLGVVGGFTYYYKVTAVNVHIEGAPTETLSATPCGLPDAPSNLTVETGDGQATVRWSPPLNDGGMTLLGYNLYMGETAGDLGFLVYAGFVRSYVVEDLDNGVELFFTVSAVNQMGEGPQSTAVSCTCLGVPSVPVGLAISLEGDGVVLSWSPPDFDGGIPVTGYVLLRGVVPDDLSVYKELGVLTTYTDLEVDAGLTYYYTIKAVNEAGEGEVATRVDVQLPKESDGDDGAGSSMWIILLVVAIAAVGVIILFARSKETPTDFSSYGEPVRKEEADEPDGPEEKPGGEPERDMAYAGEEWEDDDKPREEPVGEIEYAGEEWEAEE